MYYKMAVTNPTMPDRVEFAAWESNREWPGDYITATREGDTITITSHSVMVLGEILAEGMNGADLERLIIERVDGDCPTCPHTPEDQ